jgi:hypothetical protein
MSPVFDLPPLVPSPFRYGQEMVDARAAMKACEWLCPHCYEEEHPSCGWICNSSICMKRRGMRPTGIAIYEAQQCGFVSVAHFLQVCWPG